MSSTSALALPNLLATTTRAQLEEEHAIAGTTLTIQWRVTNLGALPIFVYDRPWCRRKGVVCADHEPCVRLLDRDSLELRYGAAPLPMSGTVSARYVPHTTEVLPGLTIERRIELPLRTSEYSPYSRGSGDNDEASAVAPFARSQIKLVVEYVDGRRATDRRLGIDGAIDFQRPGAVYAGAVTLSARIQGVPLYVTPLSDRDSFERGCTS